MLSDCSAYFSNISEKQKHYCCKISDIQLTPEFFCDSLKYDFLLQVFNRHLIQVNVDNKHICERLLIVSMRHACLWSYK